MSRSSDGGDPRKGGWWRAALKVLLSATAIWFVTRKVDLKETLGLIAGMHPGWYLLALAAYNASKLASALRLKVLLEGIGLRLAHGFNFRLLYIGGFYNLFLPGSVSGDGYKVVLLREAFGAPHRQLISAVLLDRLNGLVALLTLTLLMVNAAGVVIPLPFPSAWLLVTVPMLYAGYGLALRWWFTSFRYRVAVTHGISIGVQALQLVCAWCLLRALGVDEHIWAYLVLFMLTSVAAVIPFTIGGLGARELVMVYAAPALAVDPHSGVALSLAFFSVLALSALPGLVFTFWRTPASQASSRQR